MNVNEKREELANLRFGPYVTPVISEGVVECEVRGLVTVVGVSDGPIPWPLGQRDGERQPIVFKALARAVRQEAPQEIAAAWGVSIATAEAWRAACQKPLHRKKQTLHSPPIPWKREDDELISSVSLAEAARVTGRTLTAVRKRRRALGLPDGRRAEQRAIRTANDSTVDVASICRQVRERTEELANSLAELRKTFHRARASLAFWQSRSTLLINANGEILDAEFDRTPDSWRGAESTAHFAVDH